MSQEHRFCAEIYARLFALIDKSKQIVVSPDGQATIPGCTRGHAIPDLCFTLCGLDQQLRIEAKVQEKKRIDVQSSQREQWCEGSGFTMQPHLWMVATPDLRECWLLEHGVVGKLLKAKERSSTPLNLWPDAPIPKAASLDELALLIVTWATKHFTPPSLDVST